MEYAPPGAAWSDKAVLRAGEWLFLELEPLEELRREPGFATSAKLRVVGRRCVRMKATPLCCRTVAVHLLLGCRFIPRQRLLPPYSPAAGSALKPTAACAFKSTP